MCAMTHAFRFGAKATRATSGKEWRDLAKQAEDLGYASFQIDDHFGNQLAPVPAIMAAAAATEKIYVGPHVAGIDFRNPVLFAKEAATIDLLSDGRMMLGLGAGWSKDDYAIAGIEQASAAVRIERLGEAVQVMRGLWGTEPFSFSGTHYSVAEVNAMPKPISNIPILIGGGGKKVLSIAAREADIIGINVALTAGVIDSSAGPNATAEATEEKLQWIADAAGERYDDLELQTRVHLAVVTDDREGFAEMVAPALGLTGAQALESPHALAGTVDQLCETIIERRERFGLSYVTVGADAVESFAPVVARLAGT
jgi:probable F420-dependent oxidoreductase